MKILESLKKRDRAMTVPEVAALLNLSRQQIYKLVAEQRVPYFRIAGAIRFDPGSLADWLSAKGDRFFHPRINAG